MTVAEETRLTFHVFHEAWYWAASKLPDVAYEICVQRSYLAGGVEWEFQIEWQLMGRNEPSMLIKIWDDALYAYADVPQLFAELAKLAIPAGEAGPPPWAVISILKDLGFEDATERSMS